MHKLNVTSHPESRSAPAIRRATQRVSFTVCSIYKLLLRYYSYRVRKRTEALAGSCAEIWAENSIIAGNRCVLCGSTRATVVVQLGSLFLGEAKRFPRFKLRLLARVSTRKVSATQPRIWFYSVST